MKQENYIFVTSLLILVVAVFYFVISDKPVDVGIKPVATSTIPLDSVKLTQEQLSTSTNQFNTKEWSAVYTNNTYGFTLTFPESWKGYRVIELKDEINFGVEDQDTVFTVQVYTSKDWDSLVKKTQNIEPLPTVLKKNTKYVFTVSRAQDFSEKVMPLISVYPSILTTFTLLK